MSGEGEWQCDQLTMHHRLRRIIVVEYDKYDMILTVLTHPSPLSCQKHPSYHTSFQPPGFYDILCTLLFPYRDKQALRSCWRTNINIILGILCLTQ